MAPSPRGTPLVPKSVMTVDHGPLGSTTAFFKERMRRDAMIGVRIVHALKKRELISLNVVLEFRGKGSLHPGQELNVRLNVRRSAQRDQPPAEVPCITYRSKEQEQLERQLTGEYKHEVCRRISKNPA